MKVLYFFNLLLLSYVAVGQPLYNYRFYSKLSIGRTFFGTGDIGGFGLYAELGNNIIKTPRPFCARLLVGGELSFENGGIHPKLSNTTSVADSGPIYHTTTTGLAAKLSWYPFTGLFPGFYMAVGPVLAYTIQSFEDWVAIYYYPITVRQSEMKFDNRLVVGYRLGVGYEFFFSKICLAGVRADFNNYNNGDVNTLLAAKFGYRF